MLKFKNLNNISEDLMKSIPSMDSVAINGEVVFEMLNGHKNNDMDSSERERNPVLYGKTQIDTFMRIRDPKLNQTVPIGVPMAVEGDTVTSYRPFLAGQHTDVFKGKFSLMAGNAIDEELFEIFWLSPQREGSPCADQRVKPIFRIVNYKEDTKKSIGKIETLREALEVLKGLKEDQIRQIAASQNYGETDIDALTARVSEFAKSFPEKFLVIHKSPDTAIKANIKFAFDKQILSFDHQTRKVSSGDSELMTVKKEDMADLNGAVTKWVNESKNGKSVYEGILKQLNGE